MADKGDTSKKQPQQHQTQQHISSSSSPKGDQDQTLVTERPIIHQQTPFISSPLYVSSGASSSPFEQQQHFVDTTLNPKRPRYSSTTGQWKLLPSPPPQQQQKHPQMLIIPTESTHTTTVAAASSSDTASSPSHSPMPLLSGGSCQEGNTSKQEGGEQVHQQLRKGKYVSPVWKPNEMLWLARAWKEQYQSGGGVYDSSSSRTEQQQQQQQGELMGVGVITRGKTRADKDKEVAEFLRSHGVNRDAKTAGTKWDNMLGEFRKVYEWERGGEREHVGKSYFRLSPYERKLHRLPASFDEEVFEELSQFMGSRMRSSSSSHGRVGCSSFASGDEGIRTRSLPPPRPFKEDELPLSARTKQLTIMTSGGEPYFHGHRGNILGLESLMDISTPSSSSKELRRIGKVRMIWEESVNLWAEEGEVHRGRVKLQSSGFLHADELACFDDAMVPCPLESFEDGTLKGFSVDGFVNGQQVKVFGRRKPATPSSSSIGFGERVQNPSKPFPIRSIVQFDFRDPTDYYLDLLFRVSSPQSLPTLFELKHHIQEPPPQELRFPLRKDVFEDLPQGKELFFTTSTEPLDCRSLIYDIVGPIIRPTHNNLTLLPGSTRDSFISLWDDCINRVVTKFCPEEILITRKPSQNINNDVVVALTATTATSLLQDQWPNVTGLINHLCLWRGEESQSQSQGDPSTLLVNKLLWTYMDLPYILGYYAIANTVTFCAISKSQEGTAINRTDLLEVNLSSPSERLKAIVPCFRIGVLLSLLRKHCNCNDGSGGGGCFVYSDFDRFRSGDGVITEMTPNTCTRLFYEKRKWLRVKEIYEILDHRIPHAEFLFGSSENDMSLMFKPRGCRVKPTNCEELVEALKYVTKALVALHDLSFMHRGLTWEKVMRRDDREEEWFVCGFDEAAGAPELNRYVGCGGGVVRGGHAPEMERGLHGVKVDVWGVGYLIKTCGLGGVPKMLRELQKRCMEQNPEVRPNAADCYHHLLQLQQTALISGGAAVGGGVVMM